MKKYIEHCPKRCNAIFKYMSKRNLFKNVTEIINGYGNRYHFDVNGIIGDISVVRYSIAVEVVLTIDSKHTYLHLRDELLKIKDEK